MIGAGGKREAVARRIRLAGQGAIGPHKAPGWPAPMGGLTSRARASYIAPVGPHEQRHGMADRHLWSGGRVVNGNGL